MRTRTRPDLGRCIYWTAAMVATAALASLSPAQTAPAGKGGRGEPVELTGVVEVIQAEDLDHGRFETHYSLRETKAHGRRHALRFDRPPEGSLRGKKVRIRGRRYDGSIDVQEVLLPAGDESTPQPPDSGGAAGAAPEVRRAAFFLVDLSDARASDHYTVEGIADAVFTGARSVDGLYRERSYGQTSFLADSDGDGAPDVFGPFAIPYSGASCTGAEYLAWADAADAAAAAAGVDLALYQHRVYVLPPKGEQACPWTGLASIGCDTTCQAFIFQAEYPVVIAHELGHNLGMRHASADWDDDGVRDSEYGDFSDAMGASLSWRGFNAPHVAELGWLDAFPGSVVDVLAGGTFTLHPVDLHPLAASGPRALRLAKPGTSDTYYLSFRRLQGYDETLPPAYANGVNVHTYPGWGRTSLVRTLADGATATFSDPTGELHVTQLGLAADGSSVDLRVSFGCAEGAPSISVTPASQLAGPGETRTYAVSVTDRDDTACGPRAFGLDLVTAPGLSGALSPASLTLAPGETGSADLVLTAGPDPGTYGFTVAVAGQGAATSGWLVVEDDALAAPVVHATVRGKREIELSWGPIAGASLYRIERVDDGGGMALLETPETVYRDKNLDKEGAAYTYRVAALDAAGRSSPWSAPVTVVTGVGR